MFAAVVCCEVKMCFNTHVLWSFGGFAAIGVQFGVSSFVV